MNIYKTKIKDLLIIEHIKHLDSRGYFFELIGNEISSGLKKITSKKINFVQFNFSFSKKKNTLRGLHIQKKPFEQAKLVYCNKGKIVDFVVDVRKKSKTFGRYISFKLSGRDNKMIFIPSGFLHGFLTKTDNCEVIYGTSKFYSKKHEINISFFNKYFNFKELKKIRNFKISSKDKKGHKLEKIENLI